MAKVLVCDDDELLLELLHYRLQQCEHVVVTAQNGKEGVKLAIDEQPDLIILDAMMPVMSGFEALSALKEDKATAAIPILMLTARRQEKDIVAGLKMGAQDYLIKPFIPDELLIRIETILATKDRENAASMA